MDVMGSVPHMFGVPLNDYFCKRLVLDLTGEGWSWEAGLALMLWSHHKWLC